MYKTKEITTKEEIEFLKGVSALTFEGVVNDKENLDWLANWLNEHGALLENTELVFHIVSGKLMNESYNISAYPDDLNILIVNGINQMKIAIPRFQIGGRWLDDVLGNLTYTNNIDLDDDDDDYDWEDEYAD